LSIYCATELPALPNREERCGQMMTMLVGFGGALFCVGLYFYFRCIRTIWRMVDECRADTPSQHFARFFWHAAWRHHRRQFPESGLRRQIVREYGLAWLFVGGGFALIVIHQLRGGWPG
jgi:hypothetical protein